MDWLDHAAEQAADLQGVVVAALPAGSAWRRWGRAPWEAEALAGYFADMVHASRRAMRLMSDAEGALSFSVDLPEHRILTRELRDDMVAVLIFDLAASQGLVRLQARDLFAAIAANLPDRGTADSPRAERILAFLHRHAPDAHLLAARLALRTGLSMEHLAHPEALDAGQTALLEDAGCDLLGVDSLGLGGRA